MRPLQADPLGLGPDVNGYRWEGDGPTGATDPAGLCADKPYDDSGKRVLPQYTPGKGYGFDPYGNYWYKDPYGRPVSPCVVCHGGNADGPLPGLTPTDGRVGGQWYHSGSNRNI